MQLRPGACILGRMIGFVNAYKPAGPTSHDVVDLLRRRLPRGTRAGHCGTLDPFAEGVLVLCVGAATRLAQYVQRQPKRYRAAVTLGAASSTDDPTGEIAAADAATAGAAPPPEEAVRSVVAEFVGAILQVPPSHSAVHVEGRRAYQLARRGEAPALAARPVHVHSIEVLRYEYPVLELDVRCGGGTYIRALARDIGRELGVGGYCSALARTEIGPFRAEDAVRAEDMDPHSHLLSPLAALADMPTFTLSAQECARLAMGQTIPFSKADGTLSVGLGSGIAARTSEVAVLGPGGDLIAIASVGADGKTIRPHIVLPPSANG